jgi:hypothetical protein
MGSNSIARSTQKTSTGTIWAAKRSGATLNIGWEGAALTSKEFT